MKALLLVLFFGSAGCFLWFSLLCLKMIPFDDGKQLRLQRTAHYSAQLDVKPRPWEDCLTHANFISDSTARTHKHKHKHKHKKK